MNSPQLCCISMDLISVSSYSNREEGRKAHHTFMNPNKGEPILLIEDMKLDTERLFNKVIVSPIIIDNVDGLPCSIIVYYD